MLPTSTKGNLICWRSFAIVRPELGDPGENYPDHGLALAVNLHEGTKGGEHLDDVLQEPLICHAKGPDEMVLLYLLSDH